MTSRNSSILGLIPARGGSKGIPRKNLRRLAGKPLIHYTCEAAQASQRLTRIIVSTDDAEIATLARAAGVEVPFMRPAELAADATPTIEVVQHALHWLNEHESKLPDIIVLLQPTAPLRTAQHIDQALELLESHDTDSVVSVNALPAHVHPRWQFTLHDGRLQIYTGEPLEQLVPRRQELSTTYTRNGAIYAFRRSALESYGTIYGRYCMAYVMPAEQSINIDTIEDWQRAAALLSAQGGWRAAG